MKRGVLVLALAVCALPAHGHHVDLDETVLHTLTPIDSVPTKESLVTILQPNPLDRLRALAIDEGIDFGVRLRAIRAMPHFCPTNCRAALIEVFQSIDPELDRAGPQLLLRRATIEAIGIARTGNPDDVPLLVPYLDHPSRDIRAATARAFRDMCNTQAIVPLRTRYQNEQVDQVRLAISTALRDLGQCSQ